MEAPRRRRDEDPERVPARAEEGERSTHGPPRLDRRRLDGAAVLVEETDYRRERGGECEQKPELDAEGHDARRLGGVVPGLAREENAGDAAVGDDARLD